MNEGRFKVLQLFTGGKKESINEDILILQWKGKLSGDKEESRLYSRIGSSTQSKITGL